MKTAEWLADLGRARNALMSIEHLSSADALRFAAGIHILTEVGNDINAALQKYYADEERKQQSGAETPPAES